MQLLATSADTFSNVHDFFNSGTWLVARNLAIFTVILFYLATAYWTFKDARLRVEDSWLVGMAGLLGLVPFLGPLVYSILRPPEYIEDARERRLELREKELRLRKRALTCPVCRREAEDSFLVCPHCATQLRYACQSCQRPLEPEWQVCPYCATEPT